MHVDGRGGGYTPHTFRGINRQNPHFIQQHISVYEICSTESELDPTMAVAYATHTQYAFSMFGSQTYRYTLVAFWVLGNP